MSRRVVITGVGLVTPLGTGVEKTWEALISGKSGIVRISRFDATPFDTQIAGEVRDFEPSDWVDRKEARRLDPYELYALAASEMAMRQSGFQVTPENAERVGCIIGSGVGGLNALEEAVSTLREKGPTRISPFFMTQMLINLAPGNVSIRFGIKGPNWAPVSACATGNHAIGEAFKLIQRGTCDAVLAGSAEAPLTPMCVAGFNAMKAMCSDRNEAPETASRPFDRDRSGFVPGEGAGIMLLESLESAKARGATILAELAGYGANSDAHHVSAPSPGGEGAARCMRLALDDAGIDRERVQYVNAHGTSTPLNDLTETKALKLFFGAHAKKLQVSSNKSMIGHLLGAAGSVEAVLTTLTVHHGVIPPTINFENADPECDLDYVPNTARRQAIDVAITDSFGFGGTNAVLVIRRFEG